MKTVKWYHFWNPQSGGIGGILFEAVFLVAILLMIMLFFAVFRAYAGDTERAVTITRTQNQIETCETWIKMLESARENGPVASIILHTPGTMGSSSESIWAHIEGKLAEIFIESLKSHKRLLERQLHDMLWCR